MKVIITLSDIIGIIAMVIITLFALYLYIMNKIEEKKNKKKIACFNCKKQHTMECPNSSKCYSTSDKPYFERKKRGKDE